MLGRDKDVHTEGVTGSIPVAPTNKSTTYDAAANRSEGSPNLDAAALRLWREREMCFPAFARRMTPDAYDMVSGAWARCLADADLLMVDQMPAADIVFMRRR